MEALDLNPDFWRARRVFVTGHTGFKGSWLSLWLAHLGAEVSGYAMAPPTDPALFEVARVRDVLTNHVIGDVRDLAALTRAVAAAKPEIVLHLAAQPLVRRSYDDPVETFATNVMGTVNLLEACRGCDGVRTIVNVTTDKCYANMEREWGYREHEALGGHDPYSASKAGSELVTAAMRRSFFATRGVGVATARAGNVIGGGDWATDRLLPDFFRALDAGRSLDVRYPAATRPWQHVLEPVAGYLMLAEALSGDAARFARAWNFGPADDDARPVQWILDQLCRLAPGAGWRVIGGGHPHEAGYLKLDSSSARRELGWAPRRQLADALAATVDWHRAWRDGANMRTVSIGQITHYGAYT